MAGTVAGELGFEPRPWGPKSHVLPLHYSPMITGHMTVCRLQPRWFPDVALPTRQYPRFDADDTLETPVTL